MSKNIDLYKNYKKVGTRIHMSRNIGPHRNYKIKGPKK
jgi:hypothetical protein